MKKEKKIKFKMFFSKVKKPLIILSVVFNIIFIIALIFGFASNSKKSQVVSAKADNDLRVTTLLDSQWTLNDNCTATASYGVYNVNFNKPDASRSCDQIAIGYDFANQTLVSRANYVANHQIVDSVQWTILYGNGNIANSYHKKIVFTGGDDITNIDLISWLYDNATLDYTPYPPTPEPTPSEYDEVNRIYLGDNFVPSAYICQGGDYLLNGFAGKNNQGTLHYLDFIGFTFISNEETFNRIRFIYASVDSVAPYCTQDGQTLINTSGYSNYLCCVGMFYQYIEDNEVLSSVQVTSNRRCLIVDNGSNINAYDVRPPFMVWINDNYRTLDIIEDTQMIIQDSFLTIENKSAVQLLQVTTSVTQNVMGFTNVFSLMSSAFAGLASILGITILPGITIGLLLFIPLIVIIITTVIKLIKK